LSAALTGFLIKATGIGPGLGKGLSYGLMTAAGISGAIVGFAGASAFVGTLAAGGSLAAAFGAGAGAGCAVPPACIVIIAIIVFIIIMKMMGVGDIEKKDVLFACLPWTPPVRGDCESCGKDKLSDGSEEFPCNKYACEALGQNCKFVEGSENETGGLCISVDVSDTNAPVITELIEDDLPNGFSYESFRGKGDTEFNIVRDDGTCMSQFDTLTFGFKLDEKAKQCYIGLDPSATKEQMAPIGGGTDKFRVAFTPTAYADFVSNLPLGETSEVQLYIVCEDYSPNANDNENNKYIVNFCINRRDISVPILRRPDLLEQEEQRLHPFDTSEYLVTFELTKMPAECRWDERDTAFDLMQNELDISQCRETSGGADCTWTFPASSSGSATTICVKCKTDESGVGANVQCLSPDGQPLNLEKSTQLPTIDSFSIDMGGTSFEDGATITVGTGPTEYTVSVTTSGNNPMTCEIQLDNTGSDVMASSDGINHEYTYTDLAEGQHTITVTCTDTAGDSVSEQVSFNVEVDTQLVNIARVYIESGTLYVVTDDPASCSYATAPAPDSANACAFAVDEGTPMSTDLDGTTHSLSISEDETYYIKCKDNFGNERTGTCDIIVSKGKF
ncbi:Ig-like domain repeat protein, partial [Candidatus Pacearchaeota archaeon]